MICGHKFAIFIALKANYRLYKVSKFDEIITKLVDECTKVCQIFESIKLEMRFCSYLFTRKILDCIKKLAKVKSKIF